MKNSLRDVHYSLIFSVFLFLLFSYGALESSSFSKLAKFFPLYIAIAGVVLTLILVIVNIVKVVKEKEKKADQSGDQTGEKEGSNLKYMLWIIGYVFLIWLIGFLAATTLFLILFLHIESKFKTLYIALSLVLTHGVIFVFSNAINLYWPAGIFPLWPF
ncbi:tripartite tricarboxylate transporter TctB family protein [Bacillus oleivorans]|uniref:Tripartite tricarboxylate transporter TctB family protein n=1 Tax=Bacillus oleivorans TaxID=1448271 RepID=A0A285D6S2_9BACI|nr:tripartite tricarboxylate transporter TctB family protein [Bacillus oleivorans]SNX75520.1 tripartite tricarboxylate transporter TctB family protein [Bacillus oleivorans]